MTILERVRGARRRRAMARLIVQRRRELLRLLDLGTASGERPR